MLKLPVDFTNRMKTLLGGDYTDFLKSYELPALKGVRVNPLKSTYAILERNLPFSLSPTPFSPLSYYIETNQKVGMLPLHHAGAFYAQEPSAASAVTVLNPRPGERILDVCAAPGGKSTQIAGELDGNGLLWANEVVKNRAHSLLSNIERLGVRNAVVSSCRPEVLCKRLAGFFDKVLVDAPCSGEGMFRRDVQAIADWSIAHVQACAVRQAAILDCAAQAVKQNGILVYSTCTFSKEENEDTVSAFLQRNPQFVLEDCGVTFGMPGIGLTQTRRIYPMHGGDGHFVAKMRRVAENSCSAPTFSYKQTPMLKQAAELLHTLLQGAWTEEILQIKEQFVLPPQDLPQLEGLGVLRAGVLLGEGKTNRIEPAHALFMAAKPQELTQVLHLANDDPLTQRFLRGEELAISAEYSGFTGVAVEGVLTGFGKSSGGRLKNKYPKGLRNFS